MVGTSPAHYRLLGVTRGCTVDEVRTGYRRLAKKNHPDLYPDGEREKQQLRMMRINEAYMAVLAEISEGSDGTAGAQPPGQSAGATSGADERSEAAGPGAGASRSGAAGQQSASDQFFGAWEEKAAPGPTSPSTEIGQLRDPAYAYYKQGFTYYRMGRNRLHNKDARTIREYLEKDGNADAYFLRLALAALHYYERSYSYFLVVVQQYADSPWVSDARWKLRRIEKFSVIYQRICENLSRRSSTRRSSFSMVKGADPSK